MRIFLILFFVLFGCTKLESLKNPVEPPPEISAFEWKLMPKKGAPEPRKMHSAIWTGAEWIIWGGVTVPEPGNPRQLFASGAAYEPLTQNWTPVSNENAPDPRFGHSAVWTGSEMILWGGAQSNTTKTGAKYRPSSKTWTPISIPNDFTSRYWHQAVWTGEKMFVWGGWHLDQGGLGSGAEYEPSSDQWTLVTAEGAPRGRHGHSLTLAGRKIFIWGGFAKIEAGSAVSEGAVYDLNKKEWTPIPETPLIGARGHHSAVYGRKKLMIWGGVGKLANGNVGALNDGAIYNIKTGEWKKMSTRNAPVQRELHTAVWTGKKMLVWGGTYGASVLANGALYDPETDTWENLISPPDGVKKRYGASGTWTGDSLLVWGGASSVREDISELGDGGVLKFPTKELED